MASQAVRYLEDQAEPRCKGESLHGISEVSTVFDVRVEGEARNEAILTATTMMRASSTPNARTTIARTYMRKETKVRAMKKNVPTTPTILPAWFSLTYSGENESIAPTHPRSE